MNVSANYENVTKELALHTTIAYKSSQKKI